ncbi:MAG: ATP-binding protein [Myxococcota bacterium]|nr:ATP-binding protein [Myxococcota bacterium]
MRSETAGPTDDRLLVPWRDVCFWYRENTERLCALRWLGDRARDQGGHLAVVASAEGCAAIREVLGPLGPACADLLRFVPVEIPGPDAPADAWSGIDRRLRADLLDDSWRFGPLLVWVEVPTQAGRELSVEALSAWEGLIDKLSRDLRGAVVCAYRCTDLSDRALRALLARHRVTLNGLAGMAECTVWVHSLAGGPGAGTPAASESRVPWSAGGGPDGVRIEKLTTLGQLVPGIAHEIGNPLSIISSSLQVIHQQLAATSHSATGWAATALENVDRVKTLLQSILDVGTAGRRSVEHSDLNRMLRDVLVFVMPECRRREIALEESLHPELPRAWLEPQSFKQCILNLVRNALEAMGQGGGTLTVRTRVGEDGARALVEVENSGPPIPDDILSRLFRPFTTTKDCGTGLGLYLCREFTRG